MTKSSITRLCASRRIRPMHRADVRPTMTRGGGPMDQFDFPAPKDGFVITQFLVVSDQDRSRDFYQKVFDGKVVLERDPVIMRVANTWLILNAGGGPTDDKPTVTLETPKDPNRNSAFMNIRAAAASRSARSPGCKRRLGDADGRLAAGRAARDIDRPLNAKFLCPRRPGFVWSRIEHPVLGAVVTMRVVAWPCRADSGAFTKL